MVVHTFERRGAILDSVDSAQSCSGGVCTTTNQTVSSQWKQFQDLTTASTPAAVPGQGIPVGIKPVVLSQ